MANWASVKLIFTPKNDEGKAIIKDIYDKLVYTDPCKNENQYNTQLWEVDLEATYGLNLDCYKRGYVYQYEFWDDSNEQLYVFCEDAWDGNLNFWYTLIDSAYGENVRNCIDISYTVEECGMGIFYTNNDSDVGIQGAYLYSEGIESTLKLDKLWNFSEEGPFASPKENSGISIYNTTYGYGDIGNIRYISLPHVSYESNFDNDVDLLVELNKVMSIDKYLEDAEKKLGFPISNDYSTKLRELCTYLDSNCNVNLSLDDFEIDARSWEEFVNRDIVKKMMGETNGN